MAPQRTPKMANNKMASLMLITAMAIMTRRAPSTMAFSSSSLKKESMQSTAKYQRGRGNNDNKKLVPMNEFDISLRTIKISNFALSASSSAAAAASSTSDAAMNKVASIMAPSNLAVSLDRPLLSPVEYTYRAPVTSSKGVWSSFLAVLLSDVFKTAAVAFLLAVGLSLVPKLLSTVKSNTKNNGDNASSSGVGGSAFLSALASRILTPIQSIMLPLLSKNKQNKQREAYSTPMPFEGDGGWGKCTLRSKKDIGSFTVYEFALPESYYTVPLGLGQQLEFCCLSSSDDICTGSFYPYDDVGNAKKRKDGSTGGGTTGNSAGAVRVVVPYDKVADEGNSKFMEVLRNELEPGDEVAIKPGKSHLLYQGKHVPVTDMVYLASGLGIIPILDQIKAITPRGSSSVKVSSVTWFNNNRDDFDLAMDDLEAEYMKNPTKLAVSCIMDDVVKNPLEGNKEVEEAIPYFNAGTMAVVCGTPKVFAEKARGYLMRRGYPENCICVLP